MRYYPFFQNLKNIMDTLLTPNKNIGTYFPMCQLHGFGMT